VFNADGEVDAGPTDAEVVIYTMNTGLAEIESVRTLHVYQLCIPTNTTKI